jgi:HlyD family secretion protein
MERARVSLESGLIARSDYDHAKTSIDQATASLAAAEKRIEQARASLAGAQDTLTKTTIRAPIAGMVTRLAVEEGEVAVIGTMNNPGTVLLTISDLSQIEAVMQVDETDIPFIKIGQHAKITIDAFPNKDFEGEVTEVGSSPIQTATSAATEGIDFEVKIRLLAPPAGREAGPVRLGFDHHRREEGRPLGPAAGPRHPREGVFGPPQARRQEARRGGSLRPAEREDEVRRHPDRDQR